MARKLLESRAAHFAVFSLAVAAGLGQAFAGGLLPLGGDGDFHLSYAGVLRYFFSWSEDGLGVPNYAVEAVWPLPVLLAAAEPALGVRGVKLLLNFSLYLLWFSSAYLVCAELKLRASRCFLVALFFVLNPFSLSYLSRLNMSLTIVPAAMMLLFWVALRFQGRGLALFFAFGTASSLLAFANTNPPLLAVMQASTVLSVALAVMVRSGRLDPGAVAKDCLVVFSAFALFNAWWLANLVSFLASGAAGAMYTGEVAGSLLDLVVSSTDLILPRVLTMRSGFTVNPADNFFGLFYNSAPAVLLAAAPVAAAAACAAAAGTRKADCALYAAFLACLLAAFLAKGTSSPFGAAYSFLFERVPLFNIFKGPLEKFGVLYLFSFTVLLALSARSASGRAGAAFSATLALYAAFFSVPVLTGNIFPESRIGEIRGHSWAGDTETLAYMDRPGFAEAREHVRGSGGRVLAMPGNRDYYAVTFRMYGRRFYSGVDPVFSNSGRPYLIYGGDTAHLYEGVRDAGYEALLGAHGVGIVAVNLASVPRYGFATGDSPAGLERLLAGSMEARSFGEITLFDAGSSMLPRFYSSGL